MAAWRRGGAARALVAAVQGAGVRTLGPDAGPGRRGANGARGEEVGAKRQHTSHMIYMVPRLRERAQLLAHRTISTGRVLVHGVGHRP